MKLTNIDISSIKESIERVGKRELPSEDLIEFAKNTLLHEQKELAERVKMFEAGDIKENQINSFDFFNDDYHYGLFAEINDENLMTLEKEKDEDGNIVEHKGKVVDEAGKRTRMVFKSRRGWMTVFISTACFLQLAELLEKSQHFVFVGGLTTQWKNLRTQKYEKVKNDEDNYSDFPNFTFNYWQLVHIIKKGKSLELIEIPKPEEE